MTVDGTPTEQPTDAIGRPERPAFDSSVAHIARVYDYWLGGKDNYPARPIAITLIAILHLIDDEADPHGLVAKLVNAVPPGSYLAISHLSCDIAAAARAEAHERLRRLMHGKQILRSRDDVASFFSGLEMVEPGLVRVPEWRPDDEAAAKSPSALWAGVARKR